MLNETEPENDCELVCRACRETTRETNKMINLHSFDAHSHRISDLFTKYTFLFINENDGITTYICINCRNSLVEFHKFRQMCVVSYYEFLKHKSFHAKSDDGPRTTERDEIKTEDPLAIGIKSEEFSMDSSVEVKAERIDSEEAECGRSSSNECNRLQFDDEMKVEHCLKSEMGDDQTESGQFIEMEGSGQRNAKQITSESYKYKCDLCSNAYKNKFNLERHALWHKGIKNFACFECKFTARTKYELKNHMNKHLKSTQQSCEFCSRAFCTRSSLIFHMKRIHHATKRKDDYVCSICGQLFANLDEVKDHVIECIYEERLKGDAENRTNTNAKEQRFPCDFCSFVYQNLSSFTYHMKQKHYTIKRKSGYGCACCGDVFANLNGIKEHLDQHSKEEMQEKMKANQPIRKDKFKCDSCPRTYRTSFAIERHLLWHQGIKNHLCSECGFKAITKYELENHMNTHTREVKLPCEFCDRVLQARYTLITHRRLLHYTEKQVDDRYKCILCNELFDNVTEMGDHANMHRKQKSLDEIRRELESLGKKKLKKKNNRFECSICSKVYSYKTNLERHLLMHQNKRNFACSICGSRMNSKSSLSTHVKKVHEKRANYQCILCAVKFSTMQELDAHRSCVHQGPMAFVGNKTESK